MIVVRVELHSAVTGRVTEIARAVIHNVGGTVKRGNYGAFTCRGRDSDTLHKSMVSISWDESKPVRKCEITNYPRLSQHVWNLVARALTGMGYK